MQMSQKMNFLILLFLTLFSLQQSTVKAPLKGAIKAPRLHLTKRHAFNLCDFLDQLFMAADLRHCWDEFVEDAKISLFDKKTSECKVFFKPDERFIERLVERKTVPLNAFYRYVVGTQAGFKVVHVAGTEVSAKFYCSQKRPEKCKRLMPKEILGKAGSLKPCFPSWQGLEIAKIDPTIMLISSGWPRFVLMDPEFTLQGMPHMVSSKPWVPETFEYRGGHFKIETDAGDKVYTEPVLGKYIPHSYLDAVARIYRTMEMYGDFYYVPRTAPMHLHIKGCFPVQRLFLEADLTPRKRSEKPLDELTYLFVPSNSFFVGTEHPIKLGDIIHVAKGPKDGFLVLTLTFQQPELNPARAAFYCGEAKKEECEELFKSILKIQYYAGGLYDCKDEWKGLILESKKGRIEFTGAGLQPFVGPLPQPSLLFDLEWAKSKLDSMRKAKRPLATIPEVYVKAVDAAYKKYGRWFVAKLVRGMTIKTSY